MRRIVITEKQAKKFLGEDIFSYMNKNDDSSELNKDSYDINNQTLTQDPDTEQDPTLDKIGSMLTRLKLPYGPVRTMTGIYSGTMCEHAHSLDGKKFKLGKNTQQQVNSMAGGNDKMVNNMAKEDGATANSLYVRKNRLKKMEKQDPARFERIGGKQLKTSIDNILKTASSNAKAISQTSPSLQQTPAPNVQSGQGKKHNGSNIGKITYEN